MCATPNSDTEEEARLRRRIRLLKEREKGLRRERQRLEARLRQLFYRRLKRWEEGLARAPP